MWLLLVLIASTSLAQSTRDAGNSNRVTGAWVLDRDLSADPRTSLPVGGQVISSGRLPAGAVIRRGGIGRVAGPMQSVDPDRIRAVQETLRRLVEAPARMTIAEVDGAVTIRTAGGDERVLTLTSNGRATTHKDGNGLVSYTRKTRWKDGALVNEVEIEDGPTIVQSYRFLPSRGYLVLTTTIETPRSERPLELKAVYGAGPTQ